VSDPDDRARAYARAETHRVGLMLAEGGVRSDESYRLIFEGVLESAFRIGYAAGAEDVRKARELPPRREVGIARAKTRRELRRGGG